MLFFTHYIVQIIFLEFPKSLNSPCILLLKMIMRPRYIMKNTAIDKRTYYSAIKTVYLAHNVFV